MQVPSHGRGGALESSGCETEVPVHPRREGAFHSWARMGRIIASGLFFRYDFFLGRFLLDLSLVLDAARCLQLVADAQPAAVRVSAFAFSLGPQVPFSNVVLPGSACSSGAPPAVGNCRL